MNLSEPLPPVGPLLHGANPTLQPGSALEEFEIVQVLGRTSSGVLYLARHLQDGSTVAIKEYLPTAIATRGFEGRVEPVTPEHAEAYQRGLQAFVTEALTLSQFDHPNLLRVTSIWESDGTAYRTMPYLPGCSLLDWRARAPQPASQAQLRQLLDGLTGALLTLYHNGLSHGQVEPPNIYLLENGQPVLMDFDAVHQAVLSDPTRPHIDAYADPARIEELITADLHALVKVLHFAVSNDWIAPNAGEVAQHEPLADALLRFKDSASALSYQPEFLSAIDTALALAPADRPGTVTELLALFEFRATPAPEAARTEPPTEAPAPAETTAEAPEAPVAPAAAPAEEAPQPAAARPAKRPASAPPQPALNASESVLALLANFDRGARAAEDVEPFDSPEVPTLTEEAEPALPPLRPSLFDAMDAGEELPDDPVGYTRVGFTPMPRIRTRSPWPRRFAMLGLVTMVVACIGTLGWQLFGGPSG